MQINKMTKNVKDFNLEIFFYFDILLHDYEMSFVLFYIFFFCD